MRKECDLKREEFFEVRNYYRKLDDELWDLLNEWNKFSEKEKSIQRELYEAKYRDLERRYEKRKDEYIRLREEYLILIGIL